MKYNARKHKRAFELRVHSHLTAKVPKSDRKLRERVLRAVEDRLPSMVDMAALSPDDVYTHVVNSPGFCREAGGFFWILSWAVISAVVKAAIEYWFFTLPEGME